jgi:hypothetical protein
MSIMNTSDLDQARRTAQWQLWIGWATATATLVARLTTVVLQLIRGRLDPGDFSLAIFKSGLLIAVVLFYGRHRWPAYLMLGVWPFGFVLGWWLAHAPPPVLAVGLAVGLTSFLGARGARTLHALRALEQEPPLVI